MSKDPYGKRYERREFKNNTAPKGKLAFRNKNEARDVFFSPSEAQALINTETARVTSARAMGEARKAAKGSALPPAFFSPSDAQALINTETASARAMGEASTGRSNALQAAFFSPPGGSGMAGVSLRPQGANPRARYATDAEQVVLRDTLTARIVGQYSVTTPTTMSQGDCMYSSVYRAADAQGLRCVIDGILLAYTGEMPTNIQAASRAAKSLEEMQFVQAARYLVSEGLTGELNRFYGVMVDSFENDRVNYDEIIGPNTTLVRETVGLIRHYVGDASNSRVHMANREHFIRDYKNNIINLVGGNIPHSRIYSGELEYTALRNIIQELCGINIESKTSELHTQHIQIQPNTIYIENQGGGHYEYFAIGRKLADREPTIDEVVARAAVHIPKSIVNAIVNEFRGNLEGIINKIIEVYGGRPFGLNRELNKNYSAEYLRLRNIGSGRLGSASSPKPSMSLRSSSMTRNTKIARLIARGASSEEAGFALNASGSNVSGAERLLRSQGVRLSGGRKTRRKAM
jgi:hypothetical protein